MEPQTRSTPFPTFLCKKGANFYLYASDYKCVVWDQDAELAYEKLIDLVKKREEKNMRFQHFVHSLLYYVLLFSFFPKSNFSKPNKTTLKKSFSLFAILIILSSALVFLVQWNYAASFTNIKYNLPPAREKTVEFYRLSRRIEKSLKGKEDQ